MFGLLIWWYLVAYNPSDPWVAGNVISEHTTLDGDGSCEEQRRLYYMRHGEGVEVKNHDGESRRKVALAFARCEGSEHRQHIFSREKIELDNLHLEAEIRRRILKGELAPEMRSK